MKQSVQASSARAVIHDAVRQMVTVIMSLVTTLIFTLTLTLIITEMSEASAERYTPPRLLSPTQRETLSHSISPRVLSIVRRATLPKGMHTLTDLVSVGRGLRLGPHIILTASEWVMPQNQERSVQLSARCAALPDLSSEEFPSADPRSSRVSDRVPGSHHKSRVRPDVGAYILEHNRAEGWSLLKLSAPLNCSSLSRSTQEIEYSYVRSFKDLERELNDQALYIFEPPPRAPAQVILSGQGMGVFEFYRIVSGHLMPGEPLFNDSGHWVSISSGLSRPVLNTTLGVHLSLILPKPALESALKRAKLYLDD